MPSSRGSSQPRDWTQVSHIAGGFFTIWTMKEAQKSMNPCKKKSHNKVVLQKSQFTQTIRLGWKQGFFKKDFWAITLKYPLYLKVKI